MLVCCTTSISNVGFTMANLLHILFDSNSANTQNINVTTLKISVESKNGYAKAM